MAVLIALWPLVFLSPVAGGGGVALGLLLAAVPAWLAWRLIGGRTGDVLGAVEQAFEVGFLLAVAGLAVG
ncbi:Adenosylcobinamide-GDP ribazoletransferase [compost metagenome]